MGALLRVVLDTNVVVSALLKESGLERYVLDLVMNGKMALVVSAEILAEYDEVLRRPKFHLPSPLLAEFLRQLRERSRLVRPRKRLHVSLDPDDDKFLECALARRARFLVTGNQRHFPATHGSIRIVNAREILEHFVQTLKR
jgi:putative PIN family toxin of toxin-antitoxin system